MARWKNTTIHGNIPDLQAVGLGVMCLIISVAIYVFLAGYSGEYTKIMNAGVCIDDCIMTKIFTGLISLILISVVTISGLVGGVLVLTGLFGENTINVKIKQG